MTGATDPRPGDARFFARSGPFSLAEIAAAAGATVAGATVAGTRVADAGQRLSGVAPLQTAGAGDVSFLDNRKYLPLLAETRAGAVIMRPEMAAAAPATVACLVTPTPYEGWARACALFHPAPVAVAGIHPSAVIGAGAEIDQAAEIGPFAVIGAGARIGARCRIGPHAVIGPGCVLGEGVIVSAGASVSHALIGDRVMIHPGVRIGQEGFGFATTKDGFLSVPQLGRVIIEHDVDIGANTTIDRGSAQDTVIGAGTRIDNLVQIAHNVRIGRCCVIVAQVGISGSTTLEDFVVLAGQAGVSGHLTLGKGARIGPQAGVMSDVRPGIDLLGSPARPAKEFMREVATLRRFARRGGLRHAPPAPERDAKS
ncbi:UDP-3-O-(3-hydroxymyristoyl)glucosamine N-acyltransferase [Acidiphilium sp. C61]|uniref:UDP-3-O-(3-hydroxymyristoyl)glucosamine N-acyltransferase n=1 Tax=Acidiphilium sp. C61 TaxID=1671485 RepID=UPI00157B29AF|nr:UDP-3-O-(3-hydroxymyristoyl)glucosamine N-acyltransferase [Acidiphilium sp. C61]